MANFYNCVSKTLKYEDIFSEKDGSSYGLTLKFAKASSDFDLFDTDNDMTITKDDMRKLPFEKALLAYKKYYWDVFDFDEFPSERKAFLVFDSAVNHGVKMATILVQKSINLIEGYSLDVDGIYGPKTKSALLEVSIEDFIRNFQKKREDLYLAIVRDNPEKEVFLKNWLNRIEETGRDIAFFHDAD